MFWHVAVSWLWSFAEGWPPLPSWSIISLLQRVVEGRLELLADGTNSVVDLSSLLRSNAARFEVLFEARNQGSLLMQQLVGRGASFTSQT